PAILVDRDAPAVVHDRAAPVDVEYHADLAAVAGQGLVDRVVHHFEDQVVEAIGRGVADVHRRTLADGLQPLEAPNVRRGVAVAVAPGLRRLPLGHATPRTKDWSRALTSASFTCQTAAVSTAAPPSGPEKSTCPCRRSHASTRARASWSSSERRS